LTDGSSALKHAIRQEFPWIATFIGSLWIVRLIDLIFPGDFNVWFGLKPRAVDGLVGIPLMPFLHGDWSHLLSNTIPLAILLSLLAGSRANSMAIVAALVLFGDSMLWLFGRGSANHVGASGLVYGLIAFLIAAGFFEQRLVSVAIALLVGFLYGSTMLWGVLPTQGSHVSWDGHLFGAVAGFLLALILLRRPAQEAIELEATTTA
jgi:membrane associated rhomboid family serine protease